MKYIKSILGIFILLFFVSLLFLSRGEKMMGERVLDHAKGDIDGNGEEELVFLTKKLFSKYGKEVVIYSSDREIYRKDFSDLKPWKIAIGDIDGDGIEEVSIGVYKTTTFHPLMNKRPFIYRYEDGELYPKWRGSRLSRPFIDYLFYDIDGNGIDEIISIEILQNQERLIHIYKWKGFGFEGYKESKSYKDIKNLTLEDENMYVDIEDKEDSYRAEVRFEEKNIILERSE